jgi:hypothetical protein
MADGQVTAAFDDLHPWIIVTCRYGTGSSSPPGEPI